MNENNQNFWKDIAKKINNIDLDNFRDIGKINNRLGVWDPIDPSTRYYKSLMYEFCFYLIELGDKADIVKSLQDNIINFYLKNIREHNLGNPTCITFEKNIISLDYLLAIEEMIFLHSELLKSRHIVEIGSGFGRTAHSILSNFKIDRFVIIDLPEILEVSKCYLKKVLDSESFKKLEFVSNANYRDIGYFDIAINIDSMQEMPNDIAKNYLKWVYKNSSFFFTKNALGKYNPAAINLKIENDEEYSLALKMGLINKTYSLFNTQDISRARSEYLKIYCPMSFNLVKNQRGFGQYSSYELALFRKY